MSSSIKRRTPMEELSKVVFEFRTKELGLSQSQFAKKAKMAKQTVYNIEKGMKPSFDNYFKLASVMGVPASELRHLGVKSWATK